MQTSDSPSSPSTTLPGLLLRNSVLFPGSVVTVSVGRERSLALLADVHEGDLVATLVQKNPEDIDPEQDQIFSLATRARIRRIHRLNEMEFRVTFEGVDRCLVEDVLTREPYWKVQATKVDSVCEDPEQALAIMTALRQQIAELSGNSGGALGELIAKEQEPGLFADLLAAAINLDFEHQVSVLQTTEITSRLRLVTTLLGKAKATAEVQAKIDSEMRKEIGKNRKEAILREQMRAIQRELGEGGDDESEVLNERIENADLPEDVRKIVERERKRLQASGGQGPEANVIRTYLDWLLELPWNKRAEAHLKLDEVRDRLNQDHFGLEEVKRRFLEHLAVLKLAGNPRGTVLCLVGPPGVGKTSLGQSIADATNRPFVRIALGGMRDEAEIRGHRRTYVGALPGRILHAIRKAGVRNPLILLDEVDKLSQGWGRAAESTLLEVLDPEQNKGFVDHYLETAFDLSEVLFMCTANTLETLSAPLRDRLEIIELSGYTAGEKVKIARQHLLPKRLKEHGVKQGLLEVPDSSMLTIIQDYTREAGVRQLDRELTKLCRSLALEVAQGEQEQAVVVEAEEIKKRLGKPKFRSEKAERTMFPGVAMGLAWTPFGGEILFIESSAMPGKGNLELTGQLGDVMKESARAALTYVRSHASEIVLENQALDKLDLHIHVPAGAVPKDGPSAGVTMFTALASLLSGRNVRNDTAMTGECTLRGRVLPVGGIKAKVLAAHRAGITRVILPKLNERDLDEIPEEIRESMEFFPVEDMREVLRLTLEDHVSVPVIEGGSVLVRDQHGVKQLPNVS
jgi:ATP-dependent Lon protease